MVLIRDPGDDDEDAAAGPGIDRARGANMQPDPQSIEPDRLT